MTDDLWYKNATIYSVDVGTFMDAGSDGCGDFEGLSRRLDYLAGLGVTCLWLLPFQPSPNRDNGYDVSDHYGVDPRHGTLGDFVDFTHQARQRGIRVLIDLVINHTSDEHPWFQESRRDPSSPKRDWYVWSKRRPRDHKKGRVFPGVQDTTWTWDDAASAYYFHRFYDFEPDLNVANPDVAAELQRIMGFWLQLGVDGFRIDAAPFLIESQGERRGEAPIYEKLRVMREFLQWRRGDAVLLAEANVAPEELEHYFGRHDDRVHMLFNFLVNQYLFYALASHDVRPLARAIRKTRRRAHTSQWANFLRNHDELDLARLDDDQREVVYRAFAPEEDMRLYERGIRRRLAPMLKDDPDHLRLAYSAMLTLPGTPVLRYGDEIGMGDDLSLPERTSVRTPMQWSDEPLGGFTRAERPVRKVIDDPIYGYRSRNVADQRRDPESLLEWTERMIRMRKECPEIGWGHVEIVKTGSDHVLALRYEWRGNALIAIHNFSDRPQAVTVSEDARLLVDLLSDHHSKAKKSGRHRITLDGYGYRWFRVGGLDYLLRRARE